LTRASTLGGMEAHFKPELQARVNKFAAENSGDADEYIQQLVERYIDQDIRFREAVRKGFASIERGDFIDEEEMDARVERMLRP
jgi:predicted transcriptional regulator